MRLDDFEDEPVDAYQLALEEYYERVQEMREDWEYYQEQRRRPDGPWVDLMRRVRRLL